MTGHRSSLTRRQLLLGLLAVAGCAQRRHVPPLAELYRDLGRRQTTPVLILIPGAFGSRLRHRETGKEIWPGPKSKLVLDNYREIELKIDPRSLDPIVGDVEPSGLFLEAFGRDFYRTLLHTLERIGGYRLGTLDRPPPSPGPVYFIYDYDWRLGNVANVAGLHELIERIAEIRQEPDMKVDILAHSNGGLLARYYARYGTKDVLMSPRVTPGGSGSHRIRRLLLVATPNLGTIQAVLSHVRGEEIGLRRIPTEVVATCPGVPQLMLHPGQSWLIDLRGDPVDLDLYDIETWRKLGWSIFSKDAEKRMVSHFGSRGAAEAHKEVLEAYFARSLARSRRFHESLSAPARPDEPRPYVFGGDCEPTIARLVIERDGQSYRCRERIADIENAMPHVDYERLINEPGDSVVTRSSLTGRPRSGELERVEPLELSHSVFICGSHQTLTANFSFQDNLLYTLLHHEEE